MTMVFAAIWGQAYTASATVAVLGKQTAQTATPYVFSQDHLCVPSMTCVYMYELPASHEVVAWAFRAYTGYAAQ